MANGLEQRRYSSVQHAFFFGAGVAATAAEGTEPWHKIEHDLIKKNIDKHTFLGLGFFTAARWRASATAGCRPLSSDGVRLSCNVT